MLWSSEPQEGRKQKGKVEVAAQVQQQQEEAKSLEKGEQKERQQTCIEAVVVPLEGTERFSSTMELWLLTDAIYQGDGARWWLFTVHCRDSLLAVRQGPQLPGVTGLGLLIWGGPGLSLHPASLQQTVLCGAGRSIPRLCVAQPLGVWHTGTSPQCSVLGTGQRGCAGIMVTLFLSYSCLFLSHLSVRPSVCLSVSLQAFL